jgi:hypothetical protein
MEIVLDSQAVNHLVRQPKKVGAKLSTSIDSHIKAKRLVLAIDAARGVVDEWTRTIGPEIAKALIVQWSPAFRHFGNLRNPTQSVGRKLRQLGFEKGGDRLILRVALATSDKTIVSHDCDFWDPADTDSPGDPRAPVAALCRKHLGVTVMLIPGLVRSLKSGK